MMSVMRRTHHKMVAVMGGILLDVVILRTSFTRTPCGAGMIDYSWVIDFGSYIYRKYWSLLLEYSRRID